MKFFVIKEPGAPRQGKKEDLEPVERYYASETKGFRVIGEGEEVFPGELENQIVLFWKAFAPVEEKGKRCLCLVEGKETYESLAGEGAEVIGTSPNKCNALLIVSAGQLMHTKLYAYTVNEEGDLVAQTAEQQMMAAILAGKVKWL